MKATVQKYIREFKNELIELSNYIHANPEFGHEEFKSCKAHKDILSKYGFEIEDNYLDMQTAFKAVYNSNKKGPTIAYLAEYDALPGIGHGCGHNILGTTSTGSGIVLSKLIDELGGKVIVFGTPAEETNGAKVDMANNGAFDEVDIVLMAHPADEYYKSGKSLAMEAIEFTFKGKTAHAASEPEEGINALDAAINTFNNINALREHIKYDSRIHGIIKEGGKAANIVPDLAIAQFYVRATTKTYLTKLVEKVKNCARGASLAAGTELEITNYEASYDNLVTNNILNNLFEEKIKDMGIKNIFEPKEGFGSIDAGNVSHVCPTIHPYFSISPRKVVGHTVEFAKAAVSTYAYEQMCKTIGALVLVAVDIIKDKQLLADIKNEFVNAHK
ncbi:M20 family metallopeptidase [Abyssisolibacter fermentans]|uniref:M20 family metallopeptidase n=1 Tax=Abyssisolibacter fermentans TaxID=1766203 RepID=UPI000836E74A|nr:M20 family metallopeptidase [Abyssisolibacter fermentans]